MPRDSGGFYTLPVSNPVVDGTVIETTWANPTLSDIAVQLNNVLTRDGILGTTGPFGIMDGSLANPGLYFNSEPGTGLYRIGPQQVGFAINGVLKTQWNAAGFSVAGAFGAQKLALSGGVAGPILDVGAPLTGMAATIRGIPGNNTTLQLISAGGPTLRIDSDHADANARNWAWQGGNSIHGEIVLRVSNAKGGDPITAGATVMQILKERAVAIGQAADSNNALTVGGPVRITGYYQVEPSAITGGVLGYIHPTLRCYVGDGTGYFVNFARRVGGATTDLVSISDGNAGQTMSIAAAVGKYHLYLTGAGNGLALDNGRNIDFITSGGAGAQINYYGTDAIELIGRHASAKFRLYTGNGVMRYQCLENGQHIFYGASATPNVTIYNSQEVLRLAGNSAYMGFFNDANTVRTGYIQFNAGSGANAVFTKEDGGGVAITTQGAGQISLTAAGVNLIVPSAALIAVGYARIALNNDTFANGGVNVPLYGITWQSNTNYGSASGPACHVSGYGAVVFATGAAVRAWIDAAGRFWYGVTEAANRADSALANCAFVQSATPGGVGKTWTTPAKALNTTYTNTDAYPIQVIVTVALATAGAAAEFVVNGTTIMSESTSGTGNRTLQAIVPSGATFRVNSLAGTVTLQLWKELR